MYDVAETAIDEEAVTALARRDRLDLVPDLGQTTARSLVRTESSPQEAKRTGRTLNNKPTFPSAAANLRRHALIVADFAAGLAVLSMGAILLVGAMIVVGAALLIASIRR